ncbi:CDK regulator involved in ribosome export [Echinococcus multilocularis]|uniref:CDK regulator involved in ribosome export n=1 Tax=Echinococcus multilocularis TaxID=6211 RepID=A0A068YB78_ECHMU|nr:CDK regulator involved in ribosome export [Echinococcus multilocularis]
MTNYLLGKLGGTGMSSKRSKRNEEFADDDLVELDLEGFPPQSEDRDGIIQLLRQHIPKASNVNLGELADYIIAQGSVGTVVKNGSSETDTVEDDDDDIVFSLTTVITLCGSVVSRSSIVSELRDFLQSCISRAESSSPDYKTLLKVLMGEASEKPALLINERLVNLPPAVSAEAVAVLPQEIQTLPEEERPTHLIILTRAVKSKDTDELIYIQPEMEIVRKVAFAVGETEFADVTVGVDAESIIYVLMAIDFSSLPEILDLLSDNP